MGILRGKEFLFKNISSFFLADFQQKRAAPKITWLFVVNSFHKVAKIYPLLGIFPGRKKRGRAFSLRLSGFNCHWIAVLTNQRPRETFTGP
jgi:hypothetical protein